MSWKARLDHLIADGEHAAYLESREILETLLAQPADERWRALLERDPRLARLVDPDYEWFIKNTVTIKPSEVTEALAAQERKWNEQWQQHADHLTKSLESSLTQQLEQHTHSFATTMASSHAQWGARLEQRLYTPLRLLLLMLGLGLTILIGLSANWWLVAPSALTSAVNTEDLAKIVASSQTRWQAMLEQHAQDLAKTMASSPTAWFASWMPFADWRMVGMWLFLLVLVSGLIVLWVKFRAKATVEPSPSNDLPDLKNQEMMDIVASSQEKWGERLERRSEDLFHALERSRTKLDARLEQLLYETIARQEFQREMLWRVRAMEELGLKLIAGSDFHSELMALRSAWGESELLARLDPAAAHGVPGRPLLLVTLEHLYGDLLIQSDGENTARHSVWKVLWPSSNKDIKSRQHLETIAERVAHALRELRRGNWNAGIEQLIGINYPPIIQWTKTAITRLAVEEWYAELRQEIWGQQSPKKALTACFQTCHIPLCKPNKLCLKQLLTRFKAVV